MKIIFSIILVFFLNSFVSAQTVVYRIESGEVMGISETGNTYGHSANDYLAIVQDPIFTDGLNWQDQNYTKRVVGYAKIYIDGTVRNATQNEIDTFAAAEVDDNNQAEANRAKTYFQNHPQFRRIMTAFADILVDEFNILRAEHNLNDRTLSQLKTAILNRINKDD